MGTESSKSAYPTVRCLSCGVSCPVDEAIKHTCPKCSFCGETIRDLLPECCERSRRCAGRKVELLSKVMLLGSPGTGAKTSLAFRILNGTFKMGSFKATIGVEFGLYDVLFDEIPVHLRMQLWDVAGQERFSNMTQIYFSSADAAIVSCDLTRRSTFVELDKWMDELVQHAPEAQAVMVANKQDLVSAEAMRSFAIEADAFVARYHPRVLGWFPISVRTGFNVEEMFNFLSRHLVDKSLCNGRNGFNASREIAKSAVILLLLVRKFRPYNRECFFTLLPKEIGASTGFICSLSPCV